MKKQIINTLIAVAVVGIPSALYTLGAKPILNFFATYPTSQKPLIVLRLSCFLLLLILLAMWNLLSKYIELKKQIKTKQPLPNGAVEYLHCFWDDNFRMYSHCCHAPYVTQEKKGNYRCSACNKSFTLKHPNGEILTDREAITHVRKRKERNIPYSS